ncbi:hypothetical protein B0H15DRAFT_1018435 [Mycena belliarum]|uniref:Uncharacterized protein n=1 Tax=Mycena belliarum TaxID=1033014 RepID=A0AAD6XU84_9AGAR|nr:hypothetical protein B0H15DRAFT_1018435 [Mycena belliae]
MHTAAHPLSLSPSSPCSASRCHHPPPATWHDRGDGPDKLPTRSPLIIPISQRSRTLPESRRLRASAMSVKEPPPHLRPVAIAIEIASTIYIYIYISDHDHLPEFLLLPLPVRQCPPQALKPSCPPPLHLRPAPSAPPPAPSPCLPTHPATLLQTTASAPSMNHSRHSPRRIFSAFGGLFVLFGGGFYLARRVVAGRRAQELVLDRKQARELHRDHGHDHDQTRE